jgi:CubicO group peptidase (beta-lactamase class C family)
MLCLVGVSAVLQAQSVGDWNESTPESQGVDSRDLAKLLEFVRTERTGIDSLLVIRRGQLILETYYHSYSRNKPHILNSVTKSFVSALIGIAIGEGYIASEQSKLTEWFPEIADDPRLASKSRIEIRHLLTMTSGIDWPQTQRVNASRDMDQSPNWVQFILARPMTSTPGAHSNYSNGDAHLLSAVIQRATGGTALQFASKRLFEPLGIATPRWMSDPQGVNIGSAAIFMTPRDMAKLGHLYLNKGAWLGKQIVPAEWVRKSLSRQTGIGISAGVADYGYFWWLYPKLGMFEAWGGAGQRIGVFPDLDLVVAMTADIPDDTPVSSFSQEVYRRIIKAAKSSSSLAGDSTNTAHLQAQIALASTPLPQRTPIPWVWVVAGSAFLLVGGRLIWRRYSSR